MHVTVYTFYHQIKKQAKEIEESKPVAPAPVSEDDGGNEIYLLYMLPMFVNLLLRNRTI